MKSCYSFLAAICSFVLTGWAEPEDKLTCRILFLDGPDAAPNELFLFDGTQSQEVKLPRMNFSQVYQLPPETRGVAMLPEELLDPKLMPKGAPSAKIPEGAKDFYVIVTHDPANQVAPVRLQAINANPDRLKRGQMLWLNLTAHTVGGTVGSQALRIKPASRAVLDPPTRRAENYPVDISYRITGKEPTYPLCETKWRHDPRSRSVAFIITKPGIRTPRILVFPDYREEEEEEGP